jgi:hypothetical protein
MRLLLRLQDFAGRRMDLPVPTGEHVCSVNFGGDAVTVQGQRWMSFDDALAAGFEVPGASQLRTRLAPRPYAEPGLREALNSVVYRPQTLDIACPLPRGRYELWLWFMENFRSELHSLGLTIDGVPVARGLARLPLDAWDRYGPYTVTTDGATPVWLTLDSGPAGVHTHLMALSVYRS